MCGIYGLCSDGAALAPVLEGLSRLEYRGYDSAGVAFFTAQGAVKTLRTTERVERLKQMAAAETDGGTAIAHTRWATHGGVTLQNAHPHTVGRVTLVHNGIIENYERLRAELGYAPVSGTDTEIAAALIDGEYGADPVRALEAAAARLEGSYALAVIFSDRPGLIYAMRRESPLALMRTAVFSRPTRQLFPPAGNTMFRKKERLRSFPARACGSLAARPKNGRSAKRSAMRAARGTSIICSRKFSKSQKPFDARCGAM